MKKAKVSLSQAREEVESWLDYKKIRDSQREENQDNIEALVEWISEGVLSYDQSSGVFTHRLQFPLKNDGEGGGNFLEELTYKPRIRVKDTKPHMKGVKSSDADGRVMAYLSAITNQNRSILENLDYSDYSIATNIVVFFVQ